MQIAAVLYPKFTALDLVGPFEALAGVPGAEIVVVADKRGPVVDDSGSLFINAVADFDEVRAPDVVLLPGGMGSSAQMEDGRFHQWLRAVDRTAAWTTSVCTGSLVLAAAGLLNGRRATSHWLAIDLLAEHGALPTDERVVIDGHYITAAGVSAGIDMGLRLAALIAGDEVAQARQLAMQYAPEPPFDAGQPGSAPKKVVDGLLARRHQMLYGD